MRTWQVLAEYNAESTSFTALAGPSGTSPYSPGFNGRLTGIRLLFNRAAATSLINGIIIRLTSVSFKPNKIEVGGVGGNLQTVPVGVVPHIDYDVDQPIVANMKIDIEGKNVSETDTPVTVSVIVMGRFEVA